MKTPAAQAGTIAARKGLPFTRQPEHHDSDADNGDEFQVTIDGRIFGRTYECTDGRWVAAGGHAVTNDSPNRVAAEDLLIERYFQFDHLVDYDVDVLRDGEWHPHYRGRCGAKSERITDLGITAREIATGYDNRAGWERWTRITVASVSEPDRRVHTYANTPTEPTPGAAMADLTSHPVTPTGGHPDRPALAGHPDRPALDQLPAVNWSALGEGDRVYRHDPTGAGHPDRRQALTIRCVGESTVTGHLDGGPLVTLPRTDISGVADWPNPDPDRRPPLTPEDAARIARAVLDTTIPDESHLVGRWLARTIATDPEAIVRVLDPSVALTDPADRSWWPTTARSGLPRPEFDPDLTTAGEHPSDTNRPGRPDRPDRPGCPGC